MYYSNFNGKKSVGTRFRNSWNIPMKFPFFLHMQVVHIICKWGKVKKGLGNKIGITIYSWTGWYLCRQYNGNCECKCLNGGNGVELNFAMFGTLVICYLLKIKDNL